MSADDLRRAIETPAQLSGSDIEPGLVDLLVREVVDQPGALPLLQYPLSELWRKSRDLGFNKLTTSAYCELGSWEGALSRRADAVLAQFKNTPKEEFCRQLFLRLVQPGDGTGDTKRLVRWRELISGTPSETAALEQTVRTLADNRLIITSGNDLNADSCIEVVHEALIRNWGELRKWLEADRAGLRTHRQLTETTNEWVKTHVDARLRDQSFLFRGRRLADATDLASRSEAAFNKQELEFLAASKNQQEYEDQNRQRLGLLEELVSDSTQHFRLQDYVPSFAIPRLLNGHDFFITYAWRDGQVYTAKLAERLKARGFKCFIDTVDFSAGMNWKYEASKALKRSSHLIVVGTHDIHHSQPVLREVEAWVQLGRNVIPIDFGGTLDRKQYGSDSPLLNYIPDEVLRIMESPSSMVDGPSETTLTSLEKVCQLTSVAQRRRRAGLVLALAWIVTVSLAYLIGSR